MNYLESIKNKILHFSSALNINYDIKFNDFIFECSDQDSLKIFLRSFLIKYSEKFSNLGEIKDFPIYLIFIIEILRIIEIDNNLERFFEIKKGIIDFMLTLDSNNSLSNIQKSLEEEFSNNNQHIFFHNEIGLLAVAVINMILDSHDISNNNLVIKSIDFLGDSVLLIKNSYILTVEYNKKLVDIIDNNKKCIYNLGLLSDDLVEYMNGSMNFLNKTINMLLLSKINFLLTYKKIEDRIVKKFSENSIFIIDRISLQEFYQINSIFKNKISFITADHVLKNEILSTNIYLIEILRKNLNYQFNNQFHLEIKYFSEEKYSQTLIIKKYAGTIDDERKKILRNIIKKYTNLIILFLGDQKNPSPKQFNYNKIYSHENSKNNSPLITIFKEIDKLIFYKFFSVIEEFEEKDLREIRESIILQEDYLNEMLQIISVLINN